MTPERVWKHIQRQLRSIPVEQIAPFVAAEDGDGMWCLVAGELLFVPLRGELCEPGWDEMLVYAQVSRYVQSQPERIHTSVESARHFVRSRMQPEGERPV